MTEGNHFSREEQRKARARTRADSHLHLFEHGFRLEQPDVSPIPAGQHTELAAYEIARERNGIGIGLVVGYEGQPRFAGNNAYILDLATRQEWIKPLAYLDVVRPPSADSIRRLLSEGFAGFSLYLDPTAPGLLDWDTEQLHAIGQPGVILSVNAGQQALQRSLAGLATLEQPTVILSHLGSPGPTLSGASSALTATELQPLLQLAAQPNVTVKLSGLYDIDPVFPHEGAASVVRAVLKAFGTDRLVWGSDFSPVLDFVSPDQLFALPQWVENMLTPAERDAVLGGTLQRLVHQNAAARKALM